MDRHRGATVDRYVSHDYPRRRFLGDEISVFGGDDMTSAEMLQAGRQALPLRRFNPREPRVSAIGLCARRQVAKALGQIPPGIPWEYEEAGHVLQNRAFLAISATYAAHACDLSPEQEVCVQTPIPGVWSHIDIIIPAEGLAVEVKTGMASSPTWGELKPYHRDQVFMQWVCWQHAGGYCAVEDAVNGDYVEWVPSRCEVLYLDRETFGKIHLSVPVHFDPARARILEQKFWDIAAAIEFEQLPAPAKCWECYKCELRKECWE